MLPMPRSSVTSPIGYCYPRVRKRRLYFDDAGANGHLMTNAWTIRQFGIANISVEQRFHLGVRVGLHGQR